MRQITAARVTRDPNGPWVGINARRTDEYGPQLWELTIHGTPALPPIWVAMMDMAVTGTLDQAYEAAETVLTALTDAVADFKAARERLGSRVRRWTDTAARTDPAPS